MSDFNNYGFGGGDKKKTVEQRAEQLSAVAAPYATAPIKNQENSIYQFSHGAKQVISVMTLVTGDSYNARALQTYRSLDFSNNNSVGSEYLEQLGIHHNSGLTSFGITVTSDGVSQEKNITINDLTANQISELQKTGTFSVENTQYSVKSKESFQTLVQQDYAKQTQIHGITNASTSAQQLDAMRRIYQAGLDHMQHSANLSSIYDMRGQNADAIISECNKVSRSINKQIELIGKNMQDTDIARLTSQKALTKSELSQANRLINSNKMLSSKEKQELKDLLRDKTELNNFKTVAANGGNIDRLKGQRHYGARVLSSKVMGHDMQTGIDIYAGVIKVANKSAKAAMHAVTNTAYHTAGAAIAVMQPGAKIADAALSKMTKDRTEVMTNFTKRMNEKRIAGKRDLDRRQDAKRNHRMREYRESKRNERLSGRQKKYQDRINRNESRMTRAKNRGNDNRTERLNRKNERLRSKYDKSVRKQKRLSAKGQRKLAFRNRVNSVIGKLTAPIRFIMKPFDFVSRTFNTFKKKIISLGLKGMAAIFLPPLLAILFGMLICAPMMLLFKQETETTMPADVLKWKPWVVERCKANNDPNSNVDLNQYVNAILATIWQESGGVAETCGGDLMQCKACGLWDNSKMPSTWSEAQKSIDVGIRYFYGGLKGWPVKNPTDYSGLQMVAQGYNYGFGFWNFGGIEKGATEWSLGLSEEYSISKGGAYGHPAYGQEWLEKYQTIMLGGAEGNGEVVVKRGVDGVLETAKAQVGITENPPGSNNVIFNTDFYGHEVSGDSYPWCCAFVWWCFEKSGNGDLIPKTAGCAAMQAMIGNYGGARLLNKSAAKPGDLVIFRNGQHIGIVLENQGKGNLVTIEGNTSPEAGGNEYNGGAVAIKHHNITTSYITAILRPNYPKNEEE